MESFEVKGQVNRKLKLYRKAQIYDLVSTTVIPLSIGFTVNFVYNKLNINVNPMFAISLFSIPTFVVEILAINLKNSIKNEKFFSYSDEIKLLKKIKRDLNNGINSFSNVSNFDIVFEEMLSDERLGRSKK